MARRKHDDSEARRTEGRANGRGNGRVGRAVGVTAAVAIVLIGGYGVADAYDVMPGVLTLEPEKQVVSYPLAPGAATAVTAGVVAGEIAADAPIPDPAVLAATLDPLLADPKFGSDVSLVVTDQLTGQKLYDRSGATPLTPASTLKILSAIAVLEELGPTHTLKTRVMAGATPGSVVLVGGGDMMLAPNAGNPEAINGRAGLGDLAAATAERLLAAGTTSVTLGVDDSFFSGPTFAPALSADNVASMIYVAPVTALAMDIGKINTAEEYSKRQADPTGEAATAFAARLAEHGVTVSATETIKVRVVGDVPQDEIASVDSAPLSEIVRFFLEHSDNTITEVAGRLVASAQGLPASFEGASQAVPAALQQLGLDTTGLHMSDCSGLADGSTLTADLLTQAMSLAASPDHPKLRTAVTGLPISGLTGTLTQRIAEPGPAGFVRAKTGSLPTVSSLAGVVTDVDGRVLTFALISNGGPEFSKSTQPAVDAALGAIQGCGCRA